LTPSTSAGTIKATGDQAAVARWLHLIRENKPAIVAVLQETANEASKPQPSPAFGGNLPRWWRPFTGTRATRK
jgi:hypothetical protein